MAFKGYPIFVSKKKYCGSEWRIWASLRQHGWIAVIIERDTSHRSWRRNRFWTRWSTEQVRFSYSSDGKRFREFPGLHAWAKKELIKKYGLR